MPAASMGGPRTTPDVGEPLTTSPTDCVARKMRTDARRATKVVARTTKPRSATTQTPHFTATQRDSGFPGGLLCRSACQGDWPLAAPRFAHPILESRRRSRGGLSQRFLSALQTRKAQPRYSRASPTACARPNRANQSQTRNRQSDRRFSQSA